MSTINKILMISIAAVFDLIEFVLSILMIGLILNPIIVTIKYVIFFLWFNVQGVTFIGKTKKITAMAGSFIAEMIPLALPGFTIGVFYTIKAHAEEMGEKEKAPSEQAAPTNPAVIREKRGRSAEEEVSSQ